ncbi:hypothetical protein K461DRAFT_231438 [Myriangium duriaei CBS 260.36]|uniref:C2H2-type domain-containing protein n=1 Tax=Myriangium duriaei CBS 260.36 TaxID=1168546 RepID=A0A9P4IVR5_9PEZI|nr:hypothetical protein K461DRAFT_231438 [Myriangium duriaei CBS 260.36]
MPVESHDASAGNTYSQYYHTPSAPQQLHSRQPSTSTVTSNGSDSPITHSTSYPFIANFDNNSSPSALYPWLDETQASSLSSQGTAQQPVHNPVYYSSHASAAHAALKDMAIDHHNSNSSEDVPDFISSRRSDSTHGHNTPMTPRANTNEDTEDKAHKMPANGTDNHMSRHVELYRTESAACQDELYNPANFDPTPPSPPPTSNAADQKDLLSPQGNLVNERVRTANSIRSQSPSQPIARERSPFRQGSNLAPAAAANDYSRSPGPGMPSAASIRQREKDQASQKEFEAHRPTLKREVTKTISPKDALLDAPDSDRENSLSAFTDTVPEGYQKHFGGSEAYPNNFVSGTNQAFGQFVPMNQTSTNMGGFRGLDLNNWLATPMPAPASSAPSAAAPPAPTASQTSQISDKNPEFPAQLTSMESSMSENLPASSQESAVSPVIKRPASTSAHTGSYTCTYHGCSQRFESPANLQKHKREAHQTVPTASSTRASTTPEDDDRDSIVSGSPDPVGSGMTSSALLARNSQAGPHKCNRMNPTTGKPCNSIFSRPYDLTRHEDTIHNRQKQKVRCEYCRDEKTFSRNDALTRHMRVVHPEIDFQGKRGRRVF